MSLDRDRSMENDITNTLFHTIKKPQLLPELFINDSMKLMKETVDMFID